MTSHRNEADALTRTKFYLFVIGAFRALYPNAPLERAVYIQAICFAAQELLEGRKTHIVCNVPPRHLKSFIFSVCLPAFMLGTRPDARILVATYSQEFSREHSELFARLLETEFFRRVFPHVQIKRGHNRSNDLRLTAGGGRYATSVGGTATGMAADLIVLDDLNKASDIRSEPHRLEAERFYDETIVSRHNDKRHQKVVAVGQRLAASDFSGFLLDKGIFEHLCLPAIAQTDQAFDLYDGKQWSRRKGDLLHPERETQEVLDGLRTEMPRQAFEAQYLQQPVPDGGTVFDFGKIATCSEPPARDQCGRVVMSFDTAIKTGPRSSFTVGTVWGYHEGRWHCLHLERRRVEVPELLQLIERMARNWRPDKVLVENAGSGMTIIQQLKRDRGVSEVVGISPGRQDKETRLLDQSAHLYSGSFVIPTNAAWYEELRQEFRGFPQGRYSDQVDSISQFAKWVHSNRGRAFSQTNPETGRRRIVNRKRLRPR
jgi:predicted phage terminase large subunit-like protein